MTFPDRETWDLIDTFLSHIEFIYRREHYDSDKMLKQAIGITRSQWFLLLYLCDLLDKGLPVLCDGTKSKEDMGVTVGKIAEDFMVNPSTITGLKDSLERRKLITTIDDGGDRRQKRIAVTPAGVELVNDILLNCASSCPNVRHVTMMDAAEMRELCRLLKRYAEVTGIKVPRLYPPTICAGRRLTVQKDRPR